MAGDGPAQARRVGGILGPDGTFLPSRSKKWTNEKRNPQMSCPLGIARFQGYFLQALMLESRPYSGTPQRRIQLQLFRSLLRRPTQLRRQSKTICSRREDLPLLSLAAAFATHNLRRRTVGCAARSAASVQAIALLRTGEREDFPPAGFPSICRSLPQ